MSKLILNTECMLYEKKGIAYCTSKQVSEEFEKRHANVLRDIEELDCSEGFRQLNFEFSYYKSEQNKKQPQVIMTKDGFTFLVMGYRGKKAARFKEEYIKRFNQMEKFIYTLGIARMEYPALTEAIYNAHEVPKHYHFSNEADMINRIVVGKSAKKFREEMGIGKGESIRPYLNGQQIKFIETLQRVDIGLIVSDIPFKQRQKVLEQYINKLMLRKAA